MALFEQDEIDAEALNTIYDEMADELDKLMIWLLLKQFLIR